MVPTDWAGMAVSYEWGQTRALSLYHSILALTTLGALARPATLGRRYTYTRPWGYRRALAALL